MKKHIEIDGNCDFDDRYFERVGLEIGAALAPAVEDGNFYLYCKTVFDSGFCVGMMEQCDAMKKCKTYETVQSVIDGPEFEHFICCQRAIIPMFWHFKRLPVERFSGFILNDQRIHFQSSQDVMLQRFWRDLEDYILWVVVHGADSATLRKMTSSKLQREIGKIERQHGPFIFLAAGFSACCAYRSLLDKYFMPALNEKYKKIKKQAAEAALKRQTARLQTAAASKYIDSVKIDAQASYNDSGFKTNPFAMLKGQTHEKRIVKADYQRRKVQ